MKLSISVADFHKSIQLRKTCRVRYVEYNSNKFKIAAYSILILFMPVKNHKIEKQQRRDNRKNS